MIRLDLLRTNFQLAVMPSSWTILLFFIELIMDQLDLLPANFQINVNSYSQTPVVKNKFEDKSPPKLSYNFFPSVYPL